MGLARPSPAGLVVLHLAVCCAAGQAGAATLPAATEWNRARAAHLLRRAGFGGTPAEIDLLAAAGLERAVDAVVDYDDVVQTHPDFAPVREDDPRALRRRLRGLPEDERKEARQRLERLSRSLRQDLGAWWIRRMVLTPRPFEEKMTLFWHGYFTSGYREVRSTTMLWNQNQLLRQRALGSFRDLLVAISQDPAMLRYLDNATNRKSAPNENYARELLELFTLGEGHYTEQDIQQAARALTGWTLRDGRFVESEAMHDHGEKSFLGRQGRFDGNDIITIILEQPAAARHLATRLLRFFVCAEPDDALVDAVATVIRQQDFDLRSVLRVLFTSEAFYATEGLHNRVKSPVELVVGTLRILEIEPRDAHRLARAAAGMGENLFQPPNVKGWAGDRTWITTATVFARYKFASALLRGTPSGQRRRGMARRQSRDPDRERNRQAVRARLAEYPGLQLPDRWVESAPQPAFDPVVIIEREHLGSADRVLNHFLDRCLQLEVDHLQRRMLRRLLVSGQDRFNPRSPEGRQRVVSLVNALLTMPEYQVN